jgi:phospholipid/cholesterol/gamma-HCH transport system substrate-binding protein
MSKKTINNVKLGVFVLAGLLFLILLLYMIGKNRNLFGKSYTLRARFENVQGLVPGNNVRFAGIQAGTVKKIQIISDTVIEVSMYIDVDMKTVIRKNAVASIGTDGLVGNKVVNITPSKEQSLPAVDNDVIASHKMPDTGTMMDVLNKTNNDIAVIAAELKETVYRFNNSKAIWTLLNDNTLPESIRASLTNIKHTTAKADDFVSELNTVIDNVKKGKGTVGALLTDTSLKRNLKEAVSKINRVGTAADSLATEINTLVNGIRNDVNTGSGTIHLLLKDSAMANKITTSLDNIQKGTDGFNQNMEALKHNFLLRGYFRKLEKKKQ